MSDMIRATLSAEGTLSGNVSPNASVAGNLTQGPIIFNDFVIDLEEVPEGVLLTVRKGSNVQTALIPMGEGTGTPGVDGGYYSVGVSQTSADKLQFRFTPSKDDMPAISAQTITLPAGPKGDAGEQGKDGSPGTPGADGVSPTVSVSKSGKVTTISITDKSGTKTATVNDGADGQPGKDGSNGTSVTVKSVSTSSADGGSNVVTFSDGKTVTIKNGSKGSTGATGATGPQGPEGAAGAAGKTAYQYAQDGGYTGTENEFSTKLAEQAVSTAPQTLTDTQKAQARTNIGAVQGWKELKDKPVTVSGGDTLTWDGHTEGRETFNMGVDAYKISDVVLTEADLANGCSVVEFLSGGERAVDPSHVSVVSQDGMTMVGYNDGSEDRMYLVSAPADVFAAVVGVTVSSGTYVVYYGPDGCFASITIPGYTGFGKEVLKPDILPKALQFGDYPTGGDTLTWDGNAEGLIGVDLDGIGSNTHWLVSDTVLTMDDLTNGGTVATNSMTMGIMPEDSGVGYIAIAGIAIVSVDETAVGVDLDGIVFPKAGIYMAGACSLTINGYTGFPVTKKIEEKYLPNLTRSYNTGILTGGTSSAYTATIEGITELEPGISFIMIPHATSSKAEPTLNVNNLGAKPIWQRLSTATSSIIRSADRNWLYAGSPITVTYDGYFWVAELTRPDASNIYGVVPVENGGVPSATTADNGKFLRVVNGVASWVTVSNAEEASF